MHGEHGQVDGRVGDVSAARDAYVAGQNQTIYQPPREPSARAGRPEIDSWVVAIYRSPQGGSPIGSGVIIDNQRVLTCARAVMRDGAVLDEAWVAFPMTVPPGAPRCLVASIITPGWRLRRGPGRCPAGAGRACPRWRFCRPVAVSGAEVACGTKWWSFGFPPVHPHGSVAEGDIGAALADGWVRMDARSAYRVEPGFSGAGLWSSEFGAIVGVVAVPDEHRNGQALTIYQADRCLPGRGLKQLRRGITGHRLWRAGARCLGREPAAGP